MAKNRRKLIDDVKRALATLQPDATDRDFRPLLDFVLAQHVKVPAKAKPRDTTRIPAAMARSVPGTTAVS